LLQVSFFVLLRRGAELSVSRSTAARLENLISWFAASLMVTAGAVYAINLQNSRIDRQNGLSGRIAHYGL
jgi:hypothetical protein